MVNTDIELNKLSHKQIGYQDKARVDVSHLNAESGEVKMLHSHDFGESNNSNLNSQ